MNKSNKLESKNIQDILALTPLQEGMLFPLSAGSPGGYYFNNWTWRFPGILIPLFEDAWNFVIETNEMLRTVFPVGQTGFPVPGGPGKHTLHWKFEDLSSIGNSVEQKRQWSTVKQQDRSRQFDLQEFLSGVILAKCLKIVIICLSVIIISCMTAGVPGLFLKEFSRPMIAGNGKSTIGSPG